ncbi:16297_t:CDS:2 [Cetraspora pellucida]|uniref:16297_t:CDS:1 n=1 Tax=Cetraspora pellucida TaxID=1433469 RepID=A0A9N9C3S0_9GLOM|nr:16297_t:CDS:2 [Cetraspora pellucida]
MDLCETIKSILIKKAQEDSTDRTSWPALCIGLLQEEATNLEDTSLHLNQSIQSLIVSPTSQKSRFDKGVLERPFYLALVEMLSLCFENSGEFPRSLKTSKVFMLENTNLPRAPIMFLVTFKPIKSRLNEIEQEMKHLIGSWNGIPLVFEEFHRNSLNDFLFKFLTPRDLNTFLGLRTTLGSAIQLPPSLPECLAAFTQRYVKKNTKLVRASISNILTVGAKAFSKHCHRDTSGSFWGVCSGTEERKNEQANKVLAKILTNAAWINLHSLPHNTRVFEVRNLDGYGARWEIREPQCQQLQSQLQTDSSSTTNSFNSSDGTNIMFRGFLEPQMKDGHDKGWIH